MSKQKKARQCPRCSGRDVLLQDSFDDGIDLYICADCDFEFEVSSSRSKQKEEDDYDFDYNVDEEDQLDEEEWDER